MIASLSLCERYRDDYRRTRNPICEDSLLWRAQTFRHGVHLMPGPGVLELGCGGCLLTRQIFRVSGGENSLTAVTFDSDGRRPEALPEDVCTTR